MQVQNTANADLYNGVKIIAIIVIVILVIWCLWACFSGGRSSEYFGSDGVANMNYAVDNSNPIDYSQVDLDIIQPPNYDAYSNLIEGGSLFIPQPVYYDTQGQEVQLGKINGTSDTNVIERKNGGIEYEQMQGIGDNGMNFNQCSPACCSDQWPVPFKIPVDKMTCGSQDEFVPTSYMCDNGWQNAGCLCMKKDQNDFLVSRGFNSDL